MHTACASPAYPPVASQPFVVNEMVEVQDAGHTLFLLSLYRRREELRHGTFERLRPAQVFPPALLSARTLAAALATLVTRPLRVLRTLASLHRAAGANLWAHARVLAVTPKALPPVPLLMTPP